MEHAIGELTHNTYQDLGLVVGEADDADGEKLGCLPELPPYPCSSEEDKQLFLDVLLAM